mmetsp:Transcript_5521/g.11170  ORF Transcript_5521/g.11170 Transcript_5521/m.11170 type:complete len:261 (-) Transcript_5521:924-1706(-)
MRSRSMGGGGRSTGSLESLPCRIMGRPERRFVPSGWNGTVGVEFPASCRAGATGSDPDPCVFPWLPARRPLATRGGVTASLILSAPDVDPTRAQSLSAMPLLTISASCCAAVSFKLPSSGPLARSISPRPRPGRPLRPRRRMRCSCCLRKACWGPMTLPGRHTRSQAMASLAAKSRCFIMYSAMSVPVRPRPARQCTARAPSLVSAMRRNLSTMLSEGVEQSVKKRSWWWKPCCTSAPRSYSLLLSRITVRIPLERNTSQ